MLQNQTCFTVIQAWPAGFPNIKFATGVREVLSNIGVPGLILILVIALVIFGPKKLPEIGRAVGQTLHEFKKSTKELVEEDEAEEKKEKKEEKKDDKETWTVERWPKQKNTIERRVLWCFLL